MLVHVHAVEEKFKSSLQVDPEEPIKALFPKVSAKLKVTILFVLCKINNNKLSNNIEYKCQNPSIEDLSARPRIESKLISDLWAQVYFY